MEKQFHTNNQPTMQCVSTRGGGALRRCSLEEDLIDVRVREGTVVSRQRNGRIVTVVQNGSVAVGVRSGRSQFSSTVVQSGGIVLQSTAGTNSVQFNNNVQVNNCVMNSCVQMNMQDVDDADDDLDDLDDLVWPGGSSTVVNVGSSTVVNVGSSRSVVSVDGVGGSGISVSVNGRSVNVVNSGITVRVSGGSTTVNIGDY
ncbi:uncharacterized protein LOC126146900 [Schistocerca cancellata]|uniref:uncharacterized protein LOC126146900 n=1 Tax=Schistocerca cancellata TaxID=274614 RepID=UPI0021196209|nr:uncharacterized protein LOC126146900 [Schistocerca cancellata]